MLDRPETGERSLLLHIGIGHRCDDDEIQEFKSLAESAGAAVVAEVSARRQRPDPRLFVGRGKAEELADVVADSCAELLLVNRPLSAGQERNLEQHLQVRVLDRNGLILDIFAQRARSFEGKLQVELAQLEHLSSRLVRGWSHLERQKGGIGLRGPGETQLETDRRLLGKRIKQLRARLAKVVSQREQGRKVRRRVGVPTVALVGYTNAGKSTLFNALTGAGALVEDKLFATLDPTVRRLRLSGGLKVVLADTVGFVRDLPHELVAAFRSTLTEAREAALLLHVIDASDPHHQDRQHQVEAVLDSVGAGDLPRLHVYNKIDILGQTARAEVNGSSVRRIWASATTGEGLDHILTAIAEHCGGERVSGRLRLGVHHSRMRARLF
ncbi:MAG: ribosome rescue GTPase HflX, partial [Gammaproteobacteria bacterium]